MDNNFIIKVGISGSLGQMNSAVINLALKEPGIKISALFEPIKKITDSDFINLENSKLYHSNDINVLKDCDIIVDFSHNTNTKNIIEFAEKSKNKLVIGTTKLSEETIKFMKNASSSIAIFYSPNMSYGINAFFSIIPVLLDKFNGFDIEIIEKHHKRKKDAPSGTALKIFDIIKDKKKNVNPVYDRSKLDRSRNEDEIGISSIRGGGIYGEHTVLFLNDNEEIEFTHKMINKDSLAKGTIYAIKYIFNKKNGLFFYEDLINENFIKG
ncbi:MAG: 4-hydroxy-tetrahydrodipicolinate reductase [Exilispira sp.]